ncbi:hypothetical protein GmHk_18G051668 [Glycine max]|nr:hypothetical protein GmHk_18G051668 [Glycine max]
MVIPSSAFPNSSQKFAKPFQTLCFSMATSPKEISASGSPSVPSSPHQEQPEFNIQPIQIIPGQASAPEKLAPRRQQGVKISENPSLATSPREVDPEMDKKIRSIVSSILKDASVPDAEKDVPTSSTPSVSVPDAEKDVPTSSTPNAEVLPSPSEEESTDEEDQSTEETPAPRAPEPAPGDLIDLEEVESDEEPIANKLAPGIAERLQSRKGKTPIKRSGRIKTMAQKKSTPITPTTSRRSKVAIPSKKRKEISSSDSDDDVELDIFRKKIDLIQHNQNEFDRCFTRPSIFLIQTYIVMVIPSSAFPNSSQKFAKPFQTLCFSMATSPKEISASGSPSVPSSPHQEQPEFNIQPIQIIPGQASAPEKLAPRRQQGVKISENPSLATSPREVDPEMDKKIRSIVSSILKDASVPDAEKDVPTSSTPSVSVPDAEKDVPTSSTPNAEVLPSPSEEESTDEEDQSTEETPAPRAPEPAPGDLIDLEEVESDEEPIANKLAPGIAERLQSRKGKTPIKRSGRIKTMAQKKSTPITPTTSRRSKVAIPSKKRKEISSSDSDDDVELDVSTSKRAKKSGKKVPGNVPDAPLDNISFHSIGNVEKWKYVYQRRLAVERELGRDALDCKETMDLIKAAGLLKTVTKLGDCYEGLVREFIVNIPSDITNRKSDEYQKVFVRGKCVRFSPAVINKYLGRPTEGVVDIDVSEHQIAKEITAKRVQHWPKKGKLSAGKLSVKYAILHRIGAANWVPTNHTSTVATGLGKFLYAVGTKSKFNFGNYIFDQTVKHSESFAVKLPIAFPTVLCGIMLSQHPNMLNHIDSVMKRESPLSLHYKLFEGTHVPDIVSTSGKAAASGAVSKDALIAELKDTCKVLEATIKATTEKKMELERLIERLTDSGLDAGEAAEEEEDPAEQEEAAEEEEDAAEETESDDDDSEATP